jgi:hypothetical protein
MLRTGSSSSHTPVTQPSLVHTPVAADHNITIIVLTCFILPAYVYHITCIHNLPLYTSQCHQQLACLLPLVLQAGPVCMQLMPQLGYLRDIACLVKCVQQASNMRVPTISVSSFQEQWVCDAGNDLVCMLCFRWRIVW